MPSEPPAAFCSSSSRGYAPPYGGTKRSCRDRYLSKLLQLAIAIRLNKKNFNQEVLNSDKPVLMDFWAPWCGPCRMVVPLVEEIAKERSDIKVVKINVDEEQELAMQFGVMSIPTLVVMKNGKIVNQVTGARPKAQILAML